MSFDIDQERLSTVDENLNRGDLTSDEFVTRLADEMPIIQRKRVTDRCEIRADIGDSESVDVTFEAREEAHGDFCRDVATTIERIVTEHKLPDSDELTSDLDPIEEDIETGPSFLVVDNAVTAEPITAGSGGATVKVYSTIAIFMALVAAIQFF